MSYTPPAGDALYFSFEGAGAYTPPTGDAIAAEWLVDGSVSGTFAGVVAIGALFVGAHGTAGAFVGAVPITADFAGAVSIAGGFAGAVSIAGGFVGVVYRYELRGEVRDSGVPVDRRVRAYRRDTGALIGEADAVGGKFQIPVGFEVDEYYVVPIHLDPGAVDYTPPCANRVLSVLAQDVA